MEFLSLQHCVSVSNEYRNNFNSRAELIEAEICSDEFQEEKKQNVLSSNVVTSSNSGSPVTIHMQGNDESQVPNSTATEFKGKGSGAELQNDYDLQTDIRKAKDNSLEDQKRIRRETEQKQSENQVAAMPVQDSSKSAK